MAKKVYVSVKLEIVQVLILIREIYYLHYEHFTIV